METTSFLGLLKKDPVADAKDTFDIKTMLNENWDKVDAACSNLSSLVKNAAGIVTGTYVGTGLYGQANKTEIDVGARVKFLYIIEISNSQGDIAFGSHGDEKIVMMWANGYAYTSCTWTETGVSFYGTSALNQMNESSSKYLYIAFVDIGGTTDAED